MPKFFTLQLVLNCVFKTVAVMSVIRAQLRRLILSERIRSLSQCDGLSQTSHLNWFHVFEIEVSYWKRFIVPCPVVWFWYIMNASVFYRLFIECYMNLLNLNINLLFCNKYARSWFILKMCLPMPKRAACFLKIPLYAVQIILEQRNHKVKLISFKAQIPISP